MSDQPATKIGKYQIIELIGEGAMGSVYRALDPVLNRIVAIKVMSAGIARDDSLRDRFLREAQSAGSLQHPNVVTIYDFGEVDGHLFIAMEFVAGVDLELLLQRPEPLPLERKLEIMIDVLAGLAYAHQHGIVHRDIKPANIRVTEEQRAKIMDFGVAHLESSKMTRTGMMMGTPNYMAPEQVTGGAMTAATDVFAVGAVLYEVLTNTRAFSADTMHQVLFKIVSEQPPRVSKVLPGVPPHLDAIVAKALQKEPRDRYQSAIEMANDLTAVHAAMGGSHSKSVSISATLAPSLSGSRRGGIPLPAQAAGAAAPTRAGTRKAVLAGGALVAVTAAAALWMVTRPSSAGDALADSSASATMPDTARPTPAPVTASAPATADSTPAKPAPPAASPAAVTEPAIVRTVRASATRARASAVAAGATEAQLAAGDRQFAAARSALDRGAQTEAVGLITDATASWLVIERLARESAKTSTTSGPPPQVPAAQPPAAQPTARVDVDTVRLVPPVVKPSTSAEVSSAPVTTPAPVVATRNNEAEIRAVVAEYARAISSRDIALIRAIYPNVSPAQQRGFEQFFASVRSLNAGLGVDGLEVRGDSADARISGTYEFVNSSGKNERQSVTFRASLKRAGPAWKLFSVR